MNISDIAGLSEPLTRLIEVISKGVGAVSAPYLTRVNAEAKAHEIRVIAAALGDVARKLELPVVYKDGAVEVWQKPDDHTLVLDAAPVDLRLDSRLDYQSRKEQANIENVTSIAASELASDDTVAKDSPDDDWITRFFKYAQDISSEQMQDLWGRILAGEIKRPGTYSLRTLDYVRSLTKPEGEMLVKVGKYALKSNGTAFIDAHDKPWLESERGVPQGLLFRLAELDVMYPSELSIRVFRDSSVEKEHFVFHDRVLVVERGGISSEIQLPIWKFTHIGTELLPLVPPCDDEEYLERLGLFFVGHKGKAFLAQTTKHLIDGVVEYQIVREVVVPESSR